MIRLEYSSLIIGEDTNEPARFIFDNTIEAVDFIATFTCALFLIKHLYKLIPEEVKEDVDDMYKDIVEKMTAIYIKLNP